MISGIYKLTFPNGKIYIGQSKDIDNRWFAYSKGYIYEQPKLKYAIKKYGWNNVVKEVPIIAYNALDRNWWEIYYINKFDTMNKGYNCTAGGVSITGYKHSQETKNKMREAALGSKNHRFGTKHTDEWKKDISKKLKGRKRTQSSIDKIVKALTGRKLSEEHKANMHKFPKGHKMHQGRVVTQEMRDKISKSLTGRVGSRLGMKTSEETKEKQRISRLKYLARKS